MNNLCLRFALIIGTIVTLSLSSANGQPPYQWVPTAAGTYNWDAEANWTGNLGGFPSTANIQANLTTDIAGDQTIQTSGALGTIRINRLDIGDASNAYTVRFSGGTTLTFDLGLPATTGPFLNMTAGSVNQIIDTPIVIAVSPLTITQSSTSGSLLISQAISGAASLTKAGAGEVILSGTNTYSAGTTISAGTLRIGNGGTTGSVAGNITNNATLIFDRSDASTYAGVISGTGSSALNKLGAGTLSLTGANTFTGVTTVSDGTLQIGNGGTTGSFAGNITNNATVAFNRSDTALTYGGVISGTGSLVKLGGGTTSLTGENTYTGGTTVSVGTLQIGNGGTTGSITGSVTTNATLAFNRSDSISDFGTIIGAGGVTKLGAGTLTFTNDHAYTGATTISAGTLQLGNGGSNGSVAGNIVNNAALVLNRSDTTSYGGVISGTGTVTKLGNVYTLTGENTYTGATTLSSGALRIGDGGTSGSLTSSVAVAGGTTIVFNRSDDSIYSGALSGSGSFDKLGAGTLSLTGASTFTGATNVVAGTLQIGNGGTTGSFAGDIANGSTVAFNRSDAAQTYDGIISGGGSLVKLGVGTTTLTGANTHTGGTTVSAGTLQIGNGGTTGSIAGSGVTTNATLAINRSDDISDSGVISGAISGTGGVTKLGAGTLTFTTDHAYTGATTISAGTLQLGNGGSNGSVAGNIVNNAALVFNRSDTTSYGGVISGTGTVTKLGVATHTLTGENTYTGQTIISAGTLRLGTNTIANTSSSQITIASGAIFDVTTGDYTVGATTSPTQRLEGLGTVLAGKVTIQGPNGGNGGTIAPGMAGTPVGTLTIDSPETFFAGGGTYEVGYNKLTGSFLAGTDNDKLQGSGSLSITATSGNPFHLKMKYTGSEIFSEGDKTITIARFEGGITGFSPSAFVLEGDIGAPGYTVALADSNRELILTFSPVPEPATVLGIAAVGLAGVGYLRRRRK